MDCQSPSYSGIVDFGFKGIRCLDISLTKTFWTTPKILNEQKK